MTIMPITDPERVKKWLGEQGVDRLDEEVFADAWAGAEAYVDARTIWEPIEVGDGQQVVPADLVQAVNIQTGRYLFRRTSPDGMVGLGELGAVRMPYTDADVERLIAPWRYFPVA